MTTETTSIFTNDFKVKNWENKFYWIEGVFYFLQGMFLAGIMTYSAVRMAALAVPLAQQATFTAVTAIPGYLKMFIGLLTDRVVIGKWGRRKPYLVIGLLLTIPAYIVYIITDSFTGLLIAQTLAWVAWAVSDTTLDALTVDITPREKDSRMQSFAQGGRYLGYAVGGVAVPVLGPIIGWTNVIIIIGLFGIFMPISALWMHEGKVTQADLKGSMSLGLMLKTVFMNKAVWIAIVINILVYAGITATLLGNYILTTFQWANDPVKLQAYGASSLVGMIGSVVGVALAGLYFKSAGFKLQTVATLAGLFVLSNLPFFVFEANPDSTMLYIVCTFLRNVGMGLMIITTYSLIMRVSMPSMEGFTFALMTSVMNVGQLLIAPKVMGATMPTMGITWSLLILAALVVVAVIFYALIRKDIDDPSTKQATAEVAQGVM